MKLMSSPKLSLKTGGIIVFVNSNNLSKLYSRIENKTLGANIRTAVKASDFAAKADEKLMLFSDATPVLVYGLGKDTELTPTAHRGCVRRALLHDHLSACTQVQILPQATDVDTTRAISEGALIGTYSWNKYRSDKKAKTLATKRQVKIIGANAAVIKEVTALNQGIELTRNVVNENAGIATSVYLEKQIRSVIRGARNTDIKVVDEKQMKKLGMNLFLAVNRGSQNPPKLVIVRYKGAAATEKYTALVGKGITFDAGGLNIKPTGHIEDMKLDMAGAGAVMGVLKNVLHFKPKKNILFAFCLAENAVDAASYKPGDVFVGYNGKSVEIGNTDAEGRLVMADANAYVSKNYKVKELINIATLTGAVLSALGQDHIGLMSDDKKMCDTLFDCATSTNDRAWPLPIYPELKKYIKSKVADLKNIAAPRGYSGTITAGAFLREFVDEKIKWAHLDIAGCAYINLSEHNYYSTGATGAGVRLLTSYVRGKK